MGPDKADLPVARRTADHLHAVLDGLSDAELAERLAGFRSLLAWLPEHDETMRPTVLALADVLAVELAVRERASQTA